MEQKNIKISVIIPVYNVEKYLNKCLESIIKQTLKEIEIIIVNDGSFDNSEEIILKYIKIDKRIKYIKKENGGLSSARNKGLEKVKGEYIAFIDSDDYIDNKMLEVMYLKGIKTGSDIVICGFKHMYESGKIRNIKKYNNVEFKDILEYSFACNKIFKKTILNDKTFKFPLNKHYEDMFLIPRIAVNSRMTWVEEPFYNYIVRENSITMKRNNNKIFDFLEACILNKKLIKNIKNKNIKKDWEIYSKNIKKNFYKLMGNYSFIFKLKVMLKTINYFKELEIFSYEDYFRHLIYIIYPKYYIKKLYLIIKINNRGDLNE